MELVAKLDINLPKNNTRTSIYFKIRIALTDKCNYYNAMLNKCDFLNYSRSELITVFNLHK